MMGVLWTPLPNKVQIHGVAEPLHQIHAEQTLVPGQI